MQSKSSGLLPCRGLSQELSEITIPEAGFRSPGPESPPCTKVSWALVAEDSAPVAFGWNVGSKCPASKELGRQPKLAPPPPPSSGPIGLHQAPDF